MSTPVTEAPPALPAATGTSLLDEFASESIFVRNNQPGPTVFTFDSKAAGISGAVTWQGQGDPNGADVQVVSRDLLRNPDFRGNIQLGIFSIVEDPAKARAALAAQQQAWAAEQAKRDNPNPEAIFHDKTNGDARPQVVVEGQANASDLHVENCLGPNCTTSVTLRPAEVGAKAPLCSGHEHLRSKFIPVEDFSKPLVHGKAPVNWIVPGVGNPIG
jgi:hypothetical protein